jgi:histidinol dehydrogenase
MKMRRIRLGAPGAEDALDTIAAAGAEAIAGAEAAAGPILEAVRREGDAALLRYTQELDGVSLEPGGIPVSEAEMKRARDALPAGVRDALALAAGRIRAFHLATLPKPVFHSTGPGERLALVPTPLHRVGLYAPGGRAAYPSTVLMSAIAAEAAGVEEIVLCTPPARDGSVPPPVLAAAGLAGVGCIFRAGGAQAIAAMACGTATVPRVEKITGPGNVYVSAAKRLVRGEVEVDKEAGPSEVAVVLDDARWAAFAAADMLAQAEHDPEAMAVGIGVGRAAADALAEELEKQIADEPRREVIEQALARRGAVAEVGNLKEALAAAERLAPEHLQLMVAGAEEVAAGVRNAGAIFCGPWSPVPAGDYIAGPNHVLPTGRAARFSSPLGVLDFMKWTGRVSLSREAMARLAAPAAVLADLEGLPAHARSLRLRLEKE